MQHYKQLFLLYQLFCMLRLFCWFQCLNFIQRLYTSPCVGSDLFKIYNTNDFIQKILQRDNVMKSSKSIATDSIENYSLPSIPLHDNHADNETVTAINDTNNKNNIHHQYATYSKQEHKTKLEAASDDIPIVKRNTWETGRPKLKEFTIQRNRLKTLQSNYRKLSEETRLSFLSKPRQVESNVTFDRGRNLYSELELFKFDHEKNISEFGRQTARWKLDVIHLPKLQENETGFLKIVNEDDLQSARQYLVDNPTLNINCSNFQGISALHMAVENRSEAMVEFLLRCHNVEIGDTPLQAVRNNSMKILEMLLEARKKDSPGLEFAGATHSADFPAHVTPLILAAQLGHYEVITLLLARGHTISRPHFVNCPCLICQNSLEVDDPLYASSSRLSVFRAISSPAYLVHVSSDPILTVFYLTAELEDNAAANRQLASAYLQLRDDVSAFAVDLMACCRTSEEVELILKQNTLCKGRRYFVLPRLLMAVNFKQKEFVAHPNTQQVLESYWLGDWHRWKRSSSFTKAVLIVGRIFVIPFILLMCMVAPHHRLVRHWQIPLNKLITHTASYCVFLSLVFYISNQDKTKQKRGPPNTGAEGPLILYVLGYTWSAVRMCFMQGPKRYFTVMWNWMEVIMLILFDLTFAFWIAAAIDVTTNTNDREDLSRKYWHQYDPTLLAEGSFCLATIFAYFRLMFLCQLNYHLGPLQVSLGKMTIDIYKYILVFTIIISAFAAGLSHFYQYYDGMVYEDEFGMKTVQVSSFTSLTDTLNTLFWALFCMAPLESADVVLENVRDTKIYGRTQENRHGYTERIGYLCFGCFEVICVIVVLNMLIATMSNTFQRVTDNVDIEWTFGRTEVYINYMLQTTLPSPFNMIPTASGMGSVVEWFRTRSNNMDGASSKWSLSNCCYIEREMEADIRKEYPVLISVLIQRYFRDKGYNSINGNNDKRKCTV